MKPQLVFKSVTKALAFLVLLLGVLTLGPSEAEAIKSLQTAPTAESWRLGVTSEGSAAYSNLIGRDVSEIAAFRSWRAKDSYYLFPASGVRRTVQTARLLLITRTGAYDQAATLSLEILDYAGTVRHTVSATSVDLKTASVGTWTSLQLSATAANLQIDPGEVLAFHFSLGGDPAGDLDVRPIFEVDVQ